MKASQKQKLFHFVNELNDSASTFQWEKVMAEIKEHSMAKLQEELKMAHEKLRLKDEEIAKLSRIRQDVEAEVEELTASLFQVSYQFRIKKSLFYGKTIGYRFEFLIQKKEEFIFYIPI